MRQTTVANDPRLYLITVAVTASDPERAARLANWVVSEYLRGRLREQAIEAYAVAEREMTALSSVFGPRHPSYLNGSAKLGAPESRAGCSRGRMVTEEREAVVAQDMVRFAAGQSLLPRKQLRCRPGPIPCFFSR